MNRQRNFQRCLAMVVALVALPQPQAFAQSTPPPDPTNTCQLSVLPQRLPIEKLKSEELLTRATGTATNLNELLAPPDLSSYNSSITRQLEQLWRLRVPTDKVSSVTSNYHFDGSSANSNPFNANNVVLEPLSIQRISTDQNTNTTVVQGGVRLQFRSLSRIRPGSYSGGLIVSVQYEGCS
ncbi:hypothetical protein [Tolypothrix sp. VBCCA 56010]|uniref:hypothetical protein n=1 Tax=Tolypothrix sp. VBCCA 56010 TaxID=3137731 RepID=UPI003D7E7378